MIRILILIRKLILILLRNNDTSSQKLAERVLCLCHAGLAVLAFKSGLTQYEDIAHEHRSCHAPVFCHIYCAAKLLPVYTADPPRRSVLHD